MPICSSEICLCVSAYGGRGLIRGRRDDDCYERSAFFTALDLQGAAAHQMQALTYIVQTDMFLADLLLGFFPPIPAGPFPALLLRDWEAGLFAEVFF